METINVLDFFEVKEGSKDYLSGDSVYDIFTCKKCGYKFQEITAIPMGCGVPFATLNERKMLEHINLAHKNYTGGMIMTSVESIIIELMLDELCGSTLTNQKRVDLLQAFREKANRVISLHKLEQELKSGDGDTKRTVIFTDVPNRTD